MPILNNFGFGIVGEKEIEGYVSLNHNTRYRLKLWNFDRKLRCDAAIKIDGQEIGVWRIDQNQSIILERPADDPGCFTFYQAGTSEAVQVGLVVGDELGLIEVVFCPEQLVAPKPADYWNEIKSLKAHVDIWKADLEIYKDLIDETPDDELNELRSLRKQLDLNPAAAKEQPYSPGGTGLSGISQDEYVVTGEIDCDYAKTTTIYLRLVAQANNRSLLQVKSTHSTPVPPPIKTTKDAELTAWIAAQQAKLIQEQAALKAAMQKNIQPETKESLMAWIAEQKQASEEAQKIIDSWKSEETEEVLVDYWG